VLYHSFANARLPHIWPLYLHKSTADLENDLLYLRTHFDVIAHDQLVALRESGRPVPPGIATITFDDGLAECFSEARPLLLKYRVPATFFICTSLVDNCSLMHRNKVALCIHRLVVSGSEGSAQLLSAIERRIRIRFTSRTQLVAWLLRLKYCDRHLIDEACECLGVDVSAFLRNRKPYMTRDEIAQLHAEGFTIGTHTVDHPELQSLSCWNKIYHQISESCEYVRAITGRVRVPFAFPFTGRSVSRPQLGKLRQEIGIDLIYDTDNFVQDEPFIVNRMCSDSPHGAGGSSSNLPQLIRAARFRHRLKGLMALTGFRGPSGSLRTSY
jgi:peptidoglycan/xylan/chitin deacetylase (PgdA/CDA1 family)